MLDSIPQDLLTMILQFLTSEARATCMLVNKHLYRAASSPCAWKDASIYLGEDAAVLDKARIFFETAVLRGLKIVGSSHLVQPMIHPSLQFLDIKLPETEETVLYLPFIPSLRTFQVHAPSTTVLCDHMERQEYSVLHTISVNVARCNICDIPAPHVRSITFRNSREPFGSLRFIHGLALDHLEFDVHEYTRTRRLWNQIARCAHIRKLIVHTTTNICLCRSVPGVEDLEVYVEFPGTEVDIHFPALRRFETLTSLSLFGETDAFTGLWTVRFTSVPNVQEWMQFFTCHVRLHVSSEATVEIDPVD